MSPLTLGVIGPGLIGGSMALDLKKSKFAGTVLGYDKDPENGAAALRLGIIDRAVSLEELMRESDIVLLCIPVDAAVRLLPSLLDRLAARPDPSSGTGRPFIMDVCSVKGPIVEAVKEHPLRGRYVAGHPMAGTEYRGAIAAQAGLFEGRAGILCETEASDADAVAVAESLFSALGMRIVRMSARQHDIHTAYVSHLSHVISFALAHTVLDKEQDDKHIFDLASGGFSSTVRLAKSNADMWTPIFLQNKENLLPVVEAYAEHLDRFRSALENEDGQELRNLIAEANKIRRIIQ